MQVTVIMHNDFPVAVLADKVDPVKFIADHKFSMWLKWCKENGIDDPTAYPDTSRLYINFACYLRPYTFTLVEATNGSTN